jgi:hypothetical protein
VTIGPWRPRWGLDHLHALAGEDLIEGAGELGVAVPDEEADGAGSVCEVDEQVAGVLRGREPSGWAVTLRMCTCRVATSMTDKTYRRLRKIVSTVKKSQASSPCA